MGKLLTLPNLVVLAIIDEYFKDILLTLCVYTTSKQVELASGQLVIYIERERESSAKPANLIIDRSIYSISLSFKLSEKTFIS